MFDSPHKHQTHDPNRTIDEAFKGMLPDNFYYNHYTLHEIYPKWTPEEWRLYLKQNERFIYNEMAAITDASARQALQRLSNGEVSAQDNASIRQILERSEQINSINQDARTFVMFQFDPSVPLQTETARQKQGRLILQNGRNANTLYNMKEHDNAIAMEYRLRLNIVIRNATGTLHFPDLNHPKITELDHAYIRLFNPTNERTDELPVFEDDEDLKDVQ